MARAFSPVGRLGRVTAASLLAVVAVSSAELGQAADWEVEPGLRVAETWTDNVGLDADGGEHEWITEVTPSVTVRGEGRRADVELRYALQNLAFAREPDRNRTQQDAAGRGTVELVNDSLFFDAEGSRAEEIASPDGAVPASTTFGGGGTADRTAWSLGPRWQYGVGRFARADAAYRREHIEGTGNAGRATDTDVTRAGLRSGPVFNTWGWALDYNRRAEDTERAAGDVESDDTVLQTASAELNVRIAPATQVFGVTGYEDNEFVNEVEGERIDGDFWEAGVRWNPRRSVAVEAAVGERFFGETARLSLRAAGPALSLDVAVNEDIVTTAQVQFERAQALVRDAEGNLILDPEGRPETVTIGIPTVTDDVIQQRRARARLGWQRGHSDIGLSATLTEREFLSDGTREDAERIGLDYRWTRLRRTTIDSGIGYTHQEFAASDRSDETLAVNLGGRRELKSNLDVALDYEWFERDSSVAGAGYTVNRITLALEARF